MAEVIFVTELDTTTMRRSRKYKSKYIRLEVENGEWLDIRYEYGAWKIMAEEAVWIEMESSNALRLRDRAKREIPFPTE